MNRKHLLYLFIGVVVFALATNAVNLHLLKGQASAEGKVNGKSVVAGATIYSIDNAWYLPQVTHLLNGDGYTIDPDNPYMQVRRTPGYSLLFAAHAVVFGQQGAYAAVRYTQVLLYALSVLALALGLYHLTGNRPLAWTAGILYGLNPFASGYLYYTMTEAIHPSFLLFSFYFFARALGSSGRQAALLWAAAGALAAATVLIRPFNGLALPFYGLVLLVYLLRKQFTLAQFVKNGALLAAGFVLVMAPWVVRNYVVTNGQVVLLEKVYGADSMGYGAGHIWFRNWWNCWGNPTTELLTAEMWHASADSAKIGPWVSNFVNSLPPEAFRGYGKPELTTAMEGLLNCYRYKYYQSGIRLLKPGEVPDPCDAAVTASFEHLIAQYKQADPLRYYVTTPVLLTKEFVLQSYSSMWGSLNPDGGFSLVQVALKAVMYLLNLLLFGALFAGLFVKGPAGLKALCVGFGLGALVFVVYGLRYVEARYMLQAYPFMYMLLALWVLQVARIPVIARLLARFTKASA